MTSRSTDASPDARAAVPSAALELVVAVSDNDVIGRNQQLPWRLSSDLKRFKALTWGKPILMGRKTYESIGKALPGRLNLVLTRSQDFAPGDCTPVSSVAAAVAAAGGAATLMVIGGGEIYRHCLPCAHVVHLTLVHAQIEGGDAFFAGWRGAGWRETFREAHAADDRNSLPYSFITLERVSQTAPPRARAAPD